MAVSDALRYHLLLINRCHGDDKEVKRLVRRTIGPSKLRRIGDLLQTANTFYVTTPILGLLQQSASAVPSVHCSADFLPEGPSGFVWFETGVQLPVIHSNYTVRKDPMGYEQQTLRGLQWALASKRAFREDGDPRLLIVPWVQPYEHRPFLCIPGAFRTWLLNEDQRAAAARESHLYAHLNNTEDLTAPIQHLFDLFAALCLFIQQRILIARTEPSAAPIAGLSHKRDAPSGKSTPKSAPVVRVVQLRRVETAQAAASTPRSVAWSCRWIVRGHWRQQWYASKREHRPLWVAPHAKGPSDKPLKPPRATVFGVTR